MPDLVTGPEPSSPTEPDAALPSLWRNRPYLLLMTGKTTQLVGAGIGAFAVPLIAYAVTGSVAQAGLIAAIGQVGGLITALPAGVVADRVDRRKLIIGCAVVGAVTWAAVALAGLLGVLAGWHLAVALLVSGVVTSFVNPAEAAALRVVVPTPQLASAMAAVQGRSAVASLIAGPVGGLLYGIGHVVPILASAIGELVVATTTWLIKVPLNERAEPDSHRHPVTDLVEGLRYVWQVPLLRATIGLFALVNLSVSGLLIAITLELVQIGTPPVLIGVIELVSGAGMLIGSLFAGRLLDRVRVGPITITALVLLSAGCAGMALLRSYPAYLILLFIPILLAPALNAGMLGYVAAITPDALQGRLNSALSLTWLLSAPVAPVVGSQLLAAFGIGPTLWAFAALLLLTTVAISLVRPLWRIGLPPTWADDAISWPRDRASRR